MQTLKIGVDWLEALLPKQILCMKDVPFVGEEIQVPIPNSSSAGRFSKTSVESSIHT